ncbi:uncharacterized protein LOC144470974 [Augochlora pura]
MEASKSLVAERGAVKAKLTVFKRFVESADVQSDTVAFEKRVRANEDLFQRFDRIQSQIEASVLDTPNEEVQLAEREQFEDSYFRTLSKAETRLAQARGLEPGTANRASPAPSDSNMTRLPVIKLPNFSGDFSQWIRFRDTFVSLVHDSERLSDMDKFNYLVSALSGPAAQIIESYSVSEANYKLAWERLKERFDDPKNLISHHVTAILDLEPAKKKNGTSLIKFIDTAVNNVRALQKILDPSDLCEAIINGVISRKLDSLSLDEWEKRVMDSPTMPAFRDLSKFLEQRAQYLTRKNSDGPSEGHSPVESQRSTKPREKYDKPYYVASHVANKESSKCVLCGDEHMLQYCCRFLAMSFSERHETVKRARMCFNCLRPGHSVKACNSSKCRKCGKMHHTLLHKEIASPPLVVEHDSNDLETLPPPTTHIAQSCMARDDLEGAILSTALAVETMVGGLGRAKRPIRSSTQVEVVSRSGGFKRKISCLVLETITEEMPNVPLNKIKLTIPRGVVPADPGFQTAGRIDLLIGAGLFWDLLCIGQIKVGLGNLLWQKTKLGWVLGGSLPWSKSQGNLKSFHSCHAITNRKLGNSISRFWKMEEISAPASKLIAHEPCELRFKQNTKRDETGRFTVAIPFSEQVLHSGKSRTQAARRLVSSEGKLRKNPDLRTKYSKFLARERIK